MLPMNTSSLFKLGSSSLHNKSVQYPESMPRDSHNAASTANPALGSCASTESHTKVSMKQLSFCSQKTLHYTFFSLPRAHGLTLKPGFLPLRATSLYLSTIYQKLKRNKTKQTLHTPCHPLSFCNLQS